MTTSVAPRLIATAAVAALLAGCGGDDEQPAPRSDKQATVIRTVTKATTSRATTEIAVRQVKELTGFSSPSANIGCYIDKRNVRCDIRRRSWKPPPKPARCESDFGQGVGLNAGGRPAFVCAGDTALGSREKLAYGEGIQAGVLRCISRRSGITCKDTRSGPGFSLSRERYRLF